LKILTWNLANYDDHPHWDVRLKLIVNEIAKHQPDVLALQEIRYNADQPSTKDSHLNMADQILKELNKLDLYKTSKVITQPAMYYDKIHWEGITLISNLETIETGNIFHTLLGASSDQNKRITQYAVMANQEMVFTIFNTHFAYEELGMKLNVGETIDYMSRFTGYPCLLVGDMNAKPDNENIHKFALEGYVDVWEKLHPKENGFTYKSFNPTKRIDFCWVNKLIMNNVKAIKIIGTEPDKNKIYPSDHLGLLIEIKE
jgi:endonuclease/exonuclease/phosphatase family metal-dependent hydrolase